MSEKFRNAWWKVKEGVSLVCGCSSIVLLGVFGVSIAFLIGVVLRGIIASVCWNMAMTEMFGFQKITMFQAFVLTFTIGCLRASYLGSAKSKKCQKDKTAKVKSVLVELTSILIAVGGVMYSWNNILPQLLNIELVRINFVQAFGFAYLFNLLFGVSKTDDKKSKQDKDNEGEKQIVTEEDATIEAESENSLR